MRFKPRAGIHGSDALGAYSGVRTAAPLPQNIQTVPILSFIKFWFLAPYRPDL